MHFAVAELRDPKRWSRRSTLLFGSINRMYRGRLILSWLLPLIAEAPGILLIGAVPRLREL